jgi:hypothetical protein
MTDEHNDTHEELDCQVTVYDGAWMTCDMTDEDADD